MGLWRAGFDVIGVDLQPQPEYPFPFIRADATAPPMDLRRAALVWASPPCQGYTWGTRRGREGKFPLLIEPIRAMLQESGRPFIIENVVGAPLQAPIVLCGEMFGLRVLRHRLFESNLPIVAPEHPKHRPPIGRARSGKPVSYYACVAGHGGDGYSYKLADWQAAMGIDWMSKKTLVESIPPAYSEHLGRQVMYHLEQEVSDG
jgi:DNA (cytosine-5)-methyltransferase 1